MSASYWAGCVRPVMISNPLRGMEILMTHNLSISPSLTVVPVFSVRILRNCTVAPNTNCWLKPASNGFLPGGHDTRAWANMFVAL